jgi:hypothetical protein
MAAPNLVYAEMGAQVSTRAADLRRKSFRELSGLPEWNTEELYVLAKEVQLTVYRNVRSDDELLVVVQASRPRYFGIFTEIQVKGFLAKSNGDYADAPENLLWDFV